MHKPRGQHSPRLEWSKERSKEQLVGEQIAQRAYLAKPNKKVQCEQPRSYWSCFCTFQAKSQLDLFDCDALDDHVIGWLVAAIGCNNTNLVHNLAANLIGHVTKDGVTALQPSRWCQGDEEL